MSLQALAGALRVSVDTESKLALVYLADQADENFISVPYLPRLAADVGVDQDHLRKIIDNLVLRRLIEPAPEHAYDCFAGTEGFRLTLARAPKTIPLESPWSKDLRASA